MVGELGDSHRRKNDNGHCEKVQGSHWTKSRRRFRVAVADVVRGRSLVFFEARYLNESLVADSSQTSSKC